MADPRTEPNVTRTEVRVVLDVYRPPDPRAGKVVARVVALDDANTRVEFQFPAESALDARQLAELEQILSALRSHTISQLRPGPPPGEPEIPVSDIPLVGFTSRDPRP